MSDAPVPRTPARGDGDAMSSGVRESLHGLQDTKTEDRHSQKITAHSRTLEDEMRREASRCLFFSRMRPVLNFNAAYWSQPIISNHHGPGRGPPPVQRPSWRCRTGTGTLTVAPCRHLPTCGTHGTAPLGRGRAPRRGAAQNNTRHPCSTPQCAGFKHAAGAPPDVVEVGCDFGETWSRFKPMLVALTTPFLPAGKVGLDLPSHSGPTSPPRRPPRTATTPCRAANHLAELVFRQYLACRRTCPPAACCGTPNARAPVSPSFP